MRSVRLRTVFGVAVALSVARGGFAQEAVPVEPSGGEPAASGAQPTPADGALAVDIEANAAGLDADALRNAIAREASVPVTSAVTTGAARLLVRGQGARGLRFEFIDAGGRRVERTIELPDGSEAKVLATAALVAASLLEDEAAELLARLRAEAKKAEPAPAAKPAEPKPAPAPTRALPARAVASPCAPRPPGVVRPFGADFAPYVGTSAVEPKGTVRRFSLEFLGGHVAGIAGGEVSPLVSLGGDFVCGVQVSGLGGWVSGPVRGVAVAGLFERTGDVYGANGAGLVALAGHVQGAQISGLVGWSDRVTGAQVSGLLSVNTRAVTGLQLAPVSVADEVRGLQLATVGIAGDVHGAQVGLLDIARRSDASVGLVTIVTEGRTTLHSFVGSDAIATVAVQHGSRLVHNYYGAAVSLAGKDGVAFGPVLGIGLHAFEDSHAFVDVDVLGTILFEPTLAEDPQAVYQGRVVGGVRFTRDFAVYAGPTYDVLFVPSGQSPRAPDGLLARTHVTGGGKLHLSPGLAIGVRGF